ncbi:MAG: tRNA adenosine(34) deaminase TadA [Clostridiales bacterium]|nr:tRNA adenosine(34) deaminase TadA [Clostridiales bacterium]
MDNEKYDYYMGLAIEEAKKAYEINEVPIGCVIVYNGEVIGKGYNSRISGKNPLLHAEIKAINEASAAVGDWRLEGCTLFVTIEPCPMCAGAILQGRMERVVFGAENPKAGCCGSILNLMDDDRFNHKVDVVKGVRKDECAGLMKDFFKHRREAK